jgi:hypothetical protein
MNRSGTLMRWLAIRLLNIAVRLLPRSRAEWVRAMLSEMQYLENDRQAVLWAAGCCIASTKERVIAMQTGNLKISPWVFCLEMILCFVPLSIGWLDFLFGGSGIIRLNVEVFNRHFIAAPGGEMVLAMMISGAFLGVLGPIGLVAAFRLIVLGHPIRSPWVRAALMVGPLLYGVLTLTGQFVTEGAAAFGFNAVDAFDLWSGVLLLSLLPSLGAAHMLLSGRDRSANTVAA